MADTKADPEPDRTPDDRVSFEYRFTWQDGREGVPPAHEFHFQRRMEIAASAMRAVMTHLDLGLEHATGIAYGLIAEEVGVWRQRYVDAGNAQKKLAEQLAKSVENLKLEKEISNRMAYRVSQLTSDTPEDETLVQVGDHLLRKNKDDTGFTKVTA